MSQNNVLFFTVSFQAVCLFLLTHAKPKAFRRNIIHIMNKVQYKRTYNVAKRPYFCLNQQKNKNRSKRTSTKNRYFGTCEQTITL